MKSYIKIFGPPVLKGIKALEKIAIDTSEVCIMDTVIETYEPRLDESSIIYSYFSPLGDITEERCSSIISKSGESVGEYDFYFDWFIDPTVEQLNELIEKIDEALAEVGVRYTITTK